MNLCRMTPVNIHTRLKIRILISTDIRPWMISQACGERMRSMNGIFVTASAVFDAQTVRGFSLTVSFCLAMIWELPYNSLINEERYWPLCLF